MFPLRVDEELELRPFEMRDAQALNDVIARNRDHLRRWLGWVASGSSLEDTRAFIARAQRQLAAGNGFQLGVWRHGELVGTVGLHYLDRATRSTEVGYWLDQEAEGRGVMTRAVRGLCRALFDELGLNRVEIRCDPRNTRSRAVPERLGFQQEGILRQAGEREGELFDHVVYGLLREDWERQER